MKAGSISSEIYKELDIFYGPIMGAISSCLRGFLEAPPGKILLGGDFSAIEARVLAWLAGDEAVLEIFRGHGKIYEAEAAGIYRIPMDKVDKYQRQVGKVAILALGYQGGVKAFMDMAKTYNLKISEDQARRIKFAWRYAHPRIVKYWSDVDNAARQAILYPGKQALVGPKGREIKFKTSGSFLFCQLPSGRVLSYPYPKIENMINEKQYNAAVITFMGENSLTRKWERMKTYGGKLVENITQAVARDLLVDGMRNLEGAGYPVVMHVHDEIVVEAKDSNSKRLEDHMKHIMELIPSWCPDLPMKTEVWSGSKYRK